MGFLEAVPIREIAKRGSLFALGAQGRNALSGSLGQSLNPLGRAHNYVSEACSYSGLYQGQALVSPLQPTASALLLSRRAFVIACDVTCIDQYKVEFINQLLQYRVLLYHLLEDFFSFYQVVGSGH